MSDKTKSVLRKTAVVLFWLGLWQLAACAVGSSLLLPSPFAVFKALVTLAKQKIFYKSVCFTLLRITAGFAAGALAGTVAGIFTAFISFANTLLSPLRSLVKATPVASLIILISLWLTKSLTPVLISFLMVMPIMWSTTHEGIISADKNLLEMSDVFKFTKTDRAKCIYIPHLLMQYKASLCTSLGFAFKSGIAAEVIAAPAFSVGKSIYESKLYLEIPELFAWTAAVIVLSVITEKIILFMIAKVKI